MKKLLTILVLIMLIISFFQITSMYALYKEEIQGQYSTLLGAWEIKVNDSDVTTSGQVESFTITEDQLGYVSSDYIQAGKIAPNGEGYFDIVIDPSNTDVSIIYEISIDTKATSNTNPDIELVDAIELSRYENYFGQGDDGQTNKTTNDIAYKDGNIYTSIIPVDKITEGYKNYIRVYFKWLNVEANNELDTQLGETQIEVPAEPALLGEGVEIPEEGIEIGAQEPETPDDPDPYPDPDPEPEPEPEIQGATILIPIEINLKQYTGEVIGNVS